MKGKIHRIVLTNGEALLVEEQLPDSKSVSAISITTESAFEREAEAYICMISADGVLVMPNSCDAGAILTCGLKPESELVPKLKVRDVVSSKNHPVLFCGTGIYDKAIVAQADPLVLVSEAGDMRWGPRTRIDPDNLVVIGQATDDMMINVDRRMMADKKYNLL